jgi:hypothetical protein
MFKAIENYQGFSYELNGIAGLMLSEVWLIKTFTFEYPLFIFVIIYNLLYVD